MKALCLVAHPDDCVIFAYSYIHNYPEHDWTIAYLTYTESEPRGAEMSAFWRQRGIDTIFLGFEDHWHDNEQKQFTRWTEERAERACWALAKDFDLKYQADSNNIPLGKDMYRSYYPQNKNTNNNKRD